MKRMLFAAAAIATALAGTQMAQAATSGTVVVDQTTTSWSTADTRPGGAVQFVSDANPPAGAGALQLTTDATNTAKAQLMTGDQAGTSLSEITALSYWTKQVSASDPAVGDPSFQLAISTTGDPSTPNTTLVYEPYWNGTVVSNAWQEWNVLDGQFWSSKSVDPSAGNDQGLVAGAGGPPLYTLADVEAMYPDAVVVGIGVNVGTYNPNYTVEADALQFNDTTYDFEPHVYTKDDCKNGGWQSASIPGAPYKNQGDCVSHFASGK